MSREELFQLVNLTEELIGSDRPNRQGLFIKPSKITIHNTSNNAEGADAKAHSRFVRNTGYYLLRDATTGEQRKNWVSWHYTIDDRIAIRQLPNNEKGIHAGSKANSTSIAIEVCMHAGINQEAANNRAAQLTALLCYDLSIPVSGVVTHKHWTGKNCPELLIGSWDAFVDKIKFYLQQLSNTVAFRSALEKAGTNPLLLTAGNNLCWSPPSSEMPFEKGTRKNKIYYRPVQEGFNHGFLETGCVTPPVLDSNMPELKKHVFIHHQNLSIYYNKDRKLAAYAACNFDKAALFDKVKRSNSFRTDPHIHVEGQLGQGFYKSKTLDIPDNQNAFDQGHIIARRYNQWGETEGEAKQGERDTYYYTTIHPQVKELNQDEWEKLESFIINSGKLDVERVSIIAGAFLHPNDPTATYIDKYYNDKRSIKIPIAFWKIVYYEIEGELKKIAFLMSQRNRLRELDFIQFEALEKIAEDPFDKLGDPLKTFIINSRLIETSTGFKFTEAIENYQHDEPLEVVIRDNETHKVITDQPTHNIYSFI